VAEVINYNNVDAFKAGTKPVVRVINKGNVVWQVFQNQGSTGRDQRLYPVQMYFDETGNPSNDRFSEFVCTTMLDDIFDQTGLGMNPSTEYVANASTNQGVLRTSNCADASMPGEADSGTPPSGCGSININTAAYLPTINESPQPQPYPGIMGFQFFFKWEDGFAPPTAPCVLPLCGFGGTGDVAYTCRLVVTGVTGDVATCVLQAWQYIKSSKSMSLHSQSVASFQWSFKEWYTIVQTFRFEPPNLTSFQQGGDQWIFTMYGGNSGTSAPDLGVNNGAWISTPPILDKAGHNSKSAELFGNVVVGGQLSSMTPSDWMVKGLLFDNFYSWGFLTNWVSEPIIPDWFFTVEQAGNHSPGNHCLLFTQGDPREDHSDDINCGYECQRYQSGVYQPQYCGPTTPTYSPPVNSDVNRILNIQAGYNGVGGAGTPFASHSNWNIKAKTDTEWQYFASPTPVTTAYAGVMEEEGKTQEEIAAVLEGIDEEKIKEELSKISEEMRVYISGLDCKFPEDYDELYSRVQRNIEVLRGLQRKD